MAGVLDPVLPNSHCNQNSQQQISSADNDSSPEDPVTGGENHCYDKKLLEAIVGGILRGRMSGSASPAESKKRKRELEETVRWVRGLAANPADPVHVIREAELKILTMRRQMYLKIEEVADPDELPSFSSLRRKMKMRQLLSGERNSKATRRSERIAKTFKLPAAHLVTLRKRIGIGELFQADVSDWSGPPSDKDLRSYKSDPQISKYLGRPISHSDKKTLKSSRVDNSCNCLSPGSVSCVRYHVNVARTQLKSELGQAYLSWGFDLMGEEAARVLTREQEMIFDGLERGIRPISLEYYGFWSLASMHLANSKSRKELVRYYFNVYLLRRLANQSRICSSDIIDSDEDEENNFDFEVERARTESSRRSQRPRKRS